MAQETVSVVIPEGVRFSDLHLAFDPATRQAQFDWAPIERICQASDVDPNMFRLGSFSDIASLFTAWYAEHLAGGGAADPVWEQILAAEPGVPGAAPGPVP